MSKKDVNFSVAKEIKTSTPSSINEVEEIIEYLKFSPLILNITYLKANEVQRVLDVLTGAICVLDKKVCVLDKENYLFLDKN
jgi:FtsZ-interacting cell division protein YlmF